MYKKTTLKELLDEIDKIEKEIQDLMIRQDRIVYELWERIPTLKDSDEFQPRILKRRL